MAQSKPRIITTPVFVDETSGEELSAEDVLDHAETSVHVLTQHLAEAKLFLARARQGTLREGDSFLDFMSTEEHGYDRTGPSVVRAEELDHDRHSR